MHSTPVRGLIALVAFLVAASAAQAQPTGDPNEFARRWIERINAKAERCAQGIMQIGRETAALIDRLQSEGKFEEARRVAERGIGIVRSTAARCSREIMHMTELGMQILKRMDASEELIEAVQQAGRRAVGRVQEAAEAAVRRILEALRD
jgi:hypothetical protein